MGQSMRRPLPFRVRERASKPSDIHTDRHTLIQVFDADDPADGTLILLRGRVALAKPTAVASSNGPLKPASPDSDSDKPKVGDCETLGGQRNYSAATVAKSRKWLPRQVSTVLEGDDEGQACDVHPDQSDGLSACVKCQLPTQQCCCEVNASSGSSWTANETRSCEVVLPSQGFEWKEVGISRGFREREFALVGVCNYFCVLRVPCCEFTYKCRYRREKAWMEAFR